MQDLIEEKRGKRRRLTQSKIKKQKNLAKLSGLSDKGQDHRFAKMHALNCGITGCVMCGNPRKIWKQKTLQEKRFLQGNDDE